MRSPRLLRILAGLVFLFFGLLLLMKWAGVDIPFEIPSDLISWKTILMALGLFFLASGNRSTGLVMLLIGGVFFIRDRYDFTLQEIAMVVIAVLLVLAGLFLLFPKLLAKRRKAFTAVTDTDSTMRAIHIFSGGTRFVKSESFAGGEVVCIFGGADIRFSGSALAPGSNTLHVSCIFGGCDIYVPEDWTVKLDTTNLFGDASDKRLSQSENIEKPPEKVLVIKGIALFGGVEVKKA